MTSKFKDRLQNIILYIYLPYILFIRTNNQDLPERYIIACNHPNYLDGALMYFLFFIKYKTKLAIFAHEKYYRKLRTKFFLRFMDCIKVGYDNPGDSLNIAYNENKRSFCLFIEGKQTRAKIRPKTGCIRLSNHHNLPIIPVKITNIGYLRKRITIGFPVQFKKDSDINECSENLLNIIYNLD